MTSNGYLPAAATVPARFADLLTTDATNGATFAPLPATVDSNMTDLRTLAPTTPSDDAATDRSDTLAPSSAQSTDEPRDDRTSPPDSSEITLSHAPFGLAGLAPFAMGGPGGSQDPLMTKQETMREMKKMGLPVKDAKSGLHRLEDGGAVLVQEEHGFRVQRLDGPCVEALQRSGARDLHEFMNSANALEGTQDIATLRRTVRAISALENSPLTCVRSRALQERLKLLKISCTDWGRAREAVARLMHVRKGHEEELHKRARQVAMLKDVLAKDREAVEQASRHEHAVARRKQRLIFGLLREAKQHVKHVADLQRSATSHSR